MEVNKESAAEWLQDALITVSNCFVKTYVIIILGELQYAASDFPVEAAAIWSHWTHLPAPPQGRVLPQARFAAVSEGHKH